MASGALSATAAYADDASFVTQAIQQFKPILDVRLRAEHVQHESLPETAEAATLRARIGAETTIAARTTLLAEAEILEPLDLDYNSTINGRTAFPVVSDPESHEINRLQLTTSSIPATTVTLGRQRIALDDQRFVGSAGWRQNEQTFDAVRVVNKSIPNVTLDAAYVDQVNRVVGKRSPLGRYNGETYLLNASTQTPLGTIGAFMYALDFEQASRASTRTVGLRLAGKKPLKPIGLQYSLAYATQNDHAANPDSVSLDYHAVELRASLRRYSAGVGVEVLEGNGRSAFATPLASLHKFQGWADVFVATPSSGVMDSYVDASFATPRFRGFDLLSATVSLHAYEAEHVSASLGSELNMQLLARWRRFDASVKLARYEAGTFGSDTTKYWLQLEYSL